MHYLQPEFEEIDKAIDKFENASRDELFSYLTCEDEVLAQIALLHIPDVKSREEAEKITFLLTEHSSETREYCAFLINRLMKNENYRKYFCAEVISESFSRAIADVNPKVCRKIIEILPYFSEITAIYPQIIKNSFEYINGLEEKNKNKNYSYNTLSFRLYWCVFALGYCINEDFLNKYKSNLTKLLYLLLDFKEYTLREKAAYLAQQINTLRDTKEIKSIIEKLSADENFFVKDIF